MTDKDRKLPPDVPPPAGERRPNDRRKSRGRSEPPRVDPKELGKVGHDDLGNAVWNWRVDVPRRRDDDPTIDLLECLDVDGLSLEDDDGTEKDDDSFNPYNKTR
ncbi:MAG: hypothetical protein R3305_01550 [Gammaproteobacteria bacterium]|nr:hypothetical protein [Gammaproteobacteria bacterium]